MTVTVRLRDHWHVTRDFASGSRATVTCAGPGRRHWQAARPVGGDSTRDS